MKRASDDYRGFEITPRPESQVRVARLARFGQSAAWHSREAAEIAIDAVLDGPPGYPERNETVTVCTHPYAFHPENRTATNYLAGTRVRVLELGMRHNGPSNLSAVAAAVRIRGPRHAEHWISLRTIRRDPGPRTFADTLTPRRPHWVRCGPHAHADARRCDGAIVRYSESAETRPWLPRALMWVAYEPDPSEQYLSYPRGRARQLGSPRRWVRPERAIIVVDSEYPVRCRCARR